MLNTSTEKTEINALEKEIKKVADEEQLEIDVPQSKDKPFNLTKTYVEQNKLDENVFNKIKAHNLLGWCLALIAGIYLVETFTHSGELTQAGNAVLEIFKMLIFALAGYLFGTNRIDSGK